MRKAPLVCFGILWLGAAAWVWSLTGQLPERVAVHFDAAGIPNGFMSRAGCRAFMLAVTLGLPTLIACATGVLPRLVPPALINLPNRDYWLAPERWRETLDFLGEQGAWLGCILLLLLGYVDRLLVGANLIEPARLSTRSFEWALALLFAATALWMLRLFRRFRVPDEG